MESNEKEESMKRLLINETMRLSPYVLVGLNNYKLTITTTFIMEAVEEKTGVLRSHLYGKSRLTSIVTARQIFCYLCRKYTKLSMVDIGKMLGKDHSTIVHSVKKAKIYKEYDKEFQEKLKAIEDRLIHPAHQEDSGDVIGNITE